MMAPVAGRLADRYSPGRLGGLGLFASSLGMVALATLSDRPSTVDIVCLTVLCGAGFGFFQAPNLKALMGSAPAERSGGASGVAACLRQVPRWRAAS